MITHEVIIIHQGLEAIVVLNEIANRDLGGRRLRAMLAHCSEPIRIRCGLEHTSEHGLGFRLERVRTPAVLQLRAMALLVPFFPAAEAWPFRGGDKPFRALVP